MTARETAQTSSRGGSPIDSLAVISICLDDDTRSFLERFVERADLVRLRSHLTHYPKEEPEGAGEWMGDPAPDICLVDFDQDRQRATATAESIHARAPRTAIFAISSQSQPDSIIQAMRSGCSEYLVKPIDREQLLEAIARVAGRRKEKKEACSAQVITFVGAKGGCGVTTLVTQLGALLASAYQRKTLVIDFHRDVGDAALYLKLTNYRYHAYELVENTDRLDAELLQSFVLRHSSGLDVIPAPEGIEPPRHIPPGAVSQTLGFLRPRYEFILIDAPPGLNNGNLDLVRSSDQLCLVTVAEVSAVRNVVRYVDQLGHEQTPREKIRVVLNRHQKRSPISDDQIEKVVRQNIFWKVPNQYAQVLKTIHGGDPLAQSSTSEVAQSLNEWAGALARKPTTGDKKKDGSGILGLWNR
jgi:pilus assembly protein CpaE